MFVLLLGIGSYAQGSVTDSIRISLLTCAPGQEVWSLYGHTAIRYENPQEGIDIAVNYGMFSFDKPHFVTRFVFGLTDYEMGIIDFQRFCEEYKYEGRKVTQQVLNLDSAQKSRIVQAIWENYRPENREYRYNYFYDNCTTRARDILFVNLSDSLHQLVGKDYHEEKTYREMIHQYAPPHTWVRFGNDILLGVGADRPTTDEQQQFLPEVLMHDFDEYLISDNATYDAPLVKEKFTVVEPGMQLTGSEFPLSPFACGAILFGITLILTLIEWKVKTIFWGYDLALMLFSGLAGIVLFLMLFSEHPTVSLNLQLLLLNPLPLFFIWRATKRTRQGRRDWWWKLWATLIILFMLGAFVQDYAEGMMFVAWSLLLRCIIHIYINIQRNEA